MYQVPTPIRLTDSLIREWVEAERERGKKPTAADTRFRYSGAGDCARYLAFAALDESTESTMDAGGVWVTGLGTRIHEWVQEAMARRFPNAKFEVPTNLGLTSGHCDAVIPASDMEAAFPGWDGGDVLYELKTMGTTKFDKQVGLKRRYRKIENPDGPAITAIIQGGLNAMANKCESVIIGSVALECVSQGVAGAIGLTDFERFIAEWVIPREVWEPAAKAELNRIDRIDTLLQGGLLPDRERVATLDGALEPIKFERDWKCNGYCEYADQCFAAGEGITEIVEVR